MVGKRLDAVLVVDDEKDMLRGVERLLQREVPGITIITCPGPDQALAVAAAMPIDLALLDVQMPSMNGMELLERLRAINTDCTAIMMTAYGTIDMAVEAMRRGAYDFITKPFETESLIRSVSKGLERSRLLRENRELKSRVSAEEAFHGFVGASAPMRRFQDRLATMAATDYTVLVRGASGTGKELAAHALHALSSRAAGPLVMVNCPAIPEHLLESELFGHTRGAFTGADSDRKGLFREAHCGTICLDEIGDIPVTVQTKLLRVLEDRRVRPLGASRTHNVDVRVVAMTNQDLEAKLRDKSFREDLFYRLNVVTLQTPSLQDIREDIPRLASCFTRQVAAELGREVPRLSGQLLERLMAMEWPGNVRQLKNKIRRLIMFAQGEEITLPELVAQDEGKNSAAVCAGHMYGLLPGESFTEAKERVCDLFSRTVIGELLRQNGGNVTRTAREAGITRAALQKMMRRLDIRSGRNPEEKR